MPRGRGVVLMLSGGLLIGLGLAVAGSVTLVLLVVQLFVNIFTVPFTQELRWYGPGLLDVEPGLLRALLVATTAGSVLLVAGAVRRYTGGA